MSLLNKYGECIIPKGTQLYRGGITTTFDNEMFFGLKKYVAGVFDTNQIQIWRTKQNIKVLFMVLELDYLSKAKSAIVDIYTEYFQCSQHNEIDDLSIKTCQQKREKFINYLKSENIIGWLSSLENKVELEICLFPDKQDFQQIIELEQIISRDNEQHNYLNALSQIEVYPSEQFFTRTKNKLKNNSSFQEYSKLMDEWIKIESEENQLEKELVRMKLFNLRMKLKI